MKKIMNMIISNNERAHDLGYTIIRIGMGIILCMIGYFKLTMDLDFFNQISMPLIGFEITKECKNWIFIVGIMELIAGLLYIVGFCTRLASLVLAAFLFIVVRFYMHSLIPLLWIFPCLFVFVIVGCFIAGSGKYSLDYMIRSKQELE